jgi:23S rRNA pseudouridine1911/1915/1917 synthase
MSELSADKSKPSAGKAFIVEEQAGLLAFLLDKLSGKSRNNVKSLLTRRAVSVDGKTVTRHDYPLRAGQTVQIAAPGQRTYERPKHLKIIYEDDELIAVNKPAGLLSIATDSEKERTAYRDVTDYVRRANPKNRIFVVHRLDRDTSGVVLFAKNEPLKRALQDNWNALAKTRGYTAVAEGRFDKKSGTVRSWLKETKTHLMYSSPTAGDGQEAVTNYRILKEARGYSLLEITLETGRKNQIRVHMKDLGHPVAGDKKYGAVTNPLGRLALHAGTLSSATPSPVGGCFFSATRRETF